MHKEQKEERKVKRSSSVSTLKKCGYLYELTNQRKITLVREK